MDDDLMIIFFLPFIVFWFIWGVFLLVGTSDNDEHELTSYQKNVCSYEGGSVKDDVCIVDGKVFEIPSQR